MKEHYQFFIFDLYGTLADIRTDESLPGLWQSTAEFLAEKGITYKPESLHKNYAAFCCSAEVRKARELAAAGVSGPAEIDIQDVWDALAARKHGKLTGSEKRELSERFRKASTCHLNPFPGAADLLAALRNAGKKIFLLTNAQESFTVPELRQLGFGGAFDRVFFSSREGVKKPSPAFFGKLWEAGVSPEASLMIGNDDICDCHGAASAGIDSLYIFTEQSPQRKRPLPENCRQIKNLTEVLKYI